MTQLNNISPAPSTTYNPYILRQQFPVLQQPMNGQPLAFLDTAASAQKPRCVIEREREVYQTCYANIHRGVYALSQQTTADYEAVRGKVARFLNAAQQNEIVFTSGTTDSINLVAHTWGAQNLQAGDAVLITELEHHANIVPWQLLQQKLGFTLHVVPMQPNGAVLLEDFKNMLTPRTKLVAFSHISNSLGTVLPVAEMTAAAHAVGAKVLVDGAQGVVHGMVDVQKLDVDFYAFSAHKLYGPTGVGVLFGKQALLADMPPYRGGGDMIEQVRFSGTTFAAPPARFEAGTPNIAGVIAFGAALDFVQNFNLTDYLFYEHSLLLAAENELQVIDGVKILSKAPVRAGVLSFVVDGLHSHDVGQILDQCGVAVRVGHHCAQPALEKLGVSSTIRASFGCYTTPEDIQQLVQTIHTAKRLLG